MQHDRSAEYISYLLMVVLTGVQQVTNELPLQPKIIAFSMCCIIAGSYRALFQMCTEFKKHYADEKKDGEEEQESSVETLGWNDAL